MRGPRPKPPEAAPTSAAGADKRFPIGDNVYRKDQWQTALAKVVGRWHETDGITYRRIEAMKEFCGPRGAGKEATATLEDQLLEGAVLLAVGAAVAGITFALHRERGPSFGRAFERPGR